MFASDIHLKMKMRQMKQDNKKTLTMKKVNTYIPKSL